MISKYQMENFYKFLKAKGIFCTFSLQKQYTLVCISANYLSPYLKLTELFKNSGSTFPLLSVNILLNLFELQMKLLSIFRTDVKSLKIH